MKAADRWTAASVLLAAAIIAPLLLRSWYAHDEGALGQAAERVLLGFFNDTATTEIYTGLLTYWHALAFRLGGIASTTLRWPLLLSALGWVALLHRIALRALPAWAACAVVSVCVLWSVPNYPAPIPSWYNLFLATAGLYALLRWREDARARWLLLAGIAGGLSFLVKLSGLAFVIGAGFALVYGSLDRQGPTSRSRGGFVVVATGIVLVLAVLWRPLAAAHVAFLLRLWLLLAVLAGGLLVLEWRAALPLRPRVASLLRTFGPFLAGVALPVALWGLFLASMGALDETWRGVFITPFRRLDSASVPPPTPDKWLAAGVIALALLPASRRAAGYSAALLGALGVALLVESAGSYAAYRHLWMAAWGLPLLLVSRAAWLMAHRAPDGAQDPRTESGLLLACIAIAILLVEFPFASPIYTLYALPLSLLAFAMLMRSGARPVHPAPLVALLALFAAFGATRLLPGTSARLGFFYAPAADTVTLAIPRGGLRVSAGDASQYHALLGSIEELAPGRRLWAGPDAPEVYFLSGLRNHTRTMFDFLDDAETARLPLPQRIAHSGATLVVLKTAPSFSARPSAGDVDALRARYPFAREVGGFHLFWQ